MKKAWIGVILILALLLAGCGEQDLHPDWPEEWTRFGNILAVETPRTRNCFTTTRRSSWC